MTGQYPVLDGRPIDKWKVTELKEELKKRKLLTRGLKDDLIKRLFEDLHKDEEEVEEEERNDTDSCTKHVSNDDGGVAEHQDDKVDEDTVPLDPKVNEIAPVGVVSEDDAENPKCDAINEDSIKNKEGDYEVENPQFGETLQSNEDKPSQVKKYDQMTEGSMQVDGNDTSKVNESAPIGVIGEDTTEGDQVNTEKDTTGKDIEEVITVETKTTVTEVIVTQIASSETASEDNKLNMEDENSMPPQIDVSKSNNQVYEVSHDLGSQVRSELFSSDSVLIYEKNELKDNLNANNVKLELDGVKAEMVQSLSSGGPASDSDFIPPDDLKHEGFVAIEKDVLENKQVELSHKSNEVDDKSDFSKIPVLKNECTVGDIAPELIHGMGESNAVKNSSAACTEEVTLLDDKEPTDMVFSKKSDDSEEVFMEQLNLDHYPDDEFMEEDVIETKPVNSNENPIKKESSSEKKDNDAAPIEKRKLQDGVNDDPPKRRRWNSESLKVLEPQSSNIRPSTTPKDSFQATKLENSLKLSDSIVGGDVPKERIVPPSPKPPTNSLKIDHFLRPFTLKAVQEMLAKTGKVSSFWMDQIKTHCYITYSTVEEAVETRNSVYNLQWPPNGGRFLVAEFVDPQEVKMRVEAPPQSPATPVSTTPTATSVHHQGLKNPLQAPPPPPLSEPPSRREKHMIPPKVQPEKEEPPIVTLDDLFKKTRAIPRIYYLPLAEEHVAAKRARGSKI